MKLRSMSLAVVLLAACGGEEKKATPPPPPVEAPPVAEEPPAKLSMDAMKAEAVATALVPSPAEMEKALANAGISNKLADMIKDRDIKMNVENKDQIAVRTGVVLADLTLTVKTASKEQMIARLDRLKEGFQKLGGGTDVQNTIDDIKNRIANDAVSREDLLKEVDELSGVLVPELQYEAGDWVVPLIQAGSWLEGAHLVSGALQAAGKYEGATGLLKQPTVVDHFTEYVNREGASKAPDEVIDRLKESLKTLKEVAGKETLGEQEVATIHSATGAVLTML